MGGMGGGAGSGDAGGAGGAVANMLADFANAYCSAARSCCAAAPGADALLADCETRLPSFSYLYGAVSRGTVVPDLNVLPGCIAALRDTATTCTVPAACQNLWQGTKAIGDACMLAEQYPI